MHSGDFHSSSEVYWSQHDNNFVRIDKSSYYKRIFVGIGGDISSMVGMKSDRTFE